MLDGLPNEYARRFPGAELVRPQLRDDTQTAVWRAFDVEEQRTVGLKVFDYGVRDAEASFARERNALRLIRNAPRGHRARNYVPVLWGSSEFADAGSHGVGVLELEWMEGQSLISWFEDEDRAPFTAESVRVIGAQLAEGLAAVHDLKLVHRDVTPGNIVFDAEADRVGLIDFGVVLHLISSGAETRVLNRGTEAWASPEWLRDPAAAGPESDQFQLGLILAALFIGESPAYWVQPAAAAPGYLHPTEVLARHQEGAAAGLRLHPRTQEDPDLARILERMLDPDPDRRYLPDRARPSVPGLAAVAELLRPADAGAIARGRATLTAITADVERPPRRAAARRLRERTPAESSEPSPSRWSPGAALAQVRRPTAVIATLLLLLGLLGIVGTALQAFGALDAASAADDLGASWPVTRLLPALLAALAGLAAYGLLRRTPAASPVTAVREAAAVIAVFGAVSAAFMWWTLLLQ